MSSRKVRAIKPGIRVLGVDDSPFVFRSNLQTLIIGVVFRGGAWLEGVMSTSITVDGFDATSKIGSMIKDSPFFKQLRVVMLNGLTFGGFNVVDIQELNSLTGLPVVAVTSRKPDFGSIQAALKKLSKGGEKWKIILKAGEVFPVFTKEGKNPIYFEAVGIDRETTEEILKLTATRSKIPEPLRAAHLVASGISLYTS